MRSREQIAIEALPRYEFSAFEDKNMQEYLLHSDVLAALPPPAQGSIDADGMPPLPLFGIDVEADTGHGETQRYQGFTADQMHAYALADRAARQSAAPGGGVALTKEELSKLRVAKADLVNRLIASGMGYGTCGVISNRLEVAISAMTAPVPSEPVPQGVPGSVEMDQNFAFNGKRLRAVAAMAGRTYDTFSDEQIDACRFAILGDIRRGLESMTAPTATSGGKAVGGFLAALKGEIPLVEPVYIGKALRAGREARVVLDGGTGPRAAVHLVNIGIQGWYHTKETAEAYAKGYNDGVKHLRHAVLEVSAPAPPPLPAATDAASVPSCPEIQKAFMTLESNGEARTIVLKFNQRADAYAVHDFLLKVGGKEYNGAATDAASVRVSAATVNKIWNDALGVAVKRAEQSESVRDAVDAIRALISKETTHGN